MNFNISVIGLNHKTAPLGVRESVSFTESQTADFLGILKNLYPHEEFVCISTCNRVEIYVGSNEGDIKTKRYIDLLASYHNIPEEAISPFVYSHTDNDALEHLFEVTSSLDSLVVGEAQILGQMKKSYKKAHQLKTTSKVLNKAFQKAFNVAKKIHTLTSIGEGNLSVSSISCQLAEKVLKGLRGKKVLLIGSGKAGTVTFRSLRKKGVDTILVSSRNFEKAMALSAEFNGKAVRFENVENFIFETDIVISSTSAPHYILHPNMFERVMERRGSKLIFLIDLAVPRDIDPVIGDIPGIYLYNIDSLRNIAAENMKRREGEFLKCRDIISREVNNFTKKIDSTLLSNEDDKLFETIKL